MIDQSGRWRLRIRADRDVPLHRMVDAVDHAQRIIDTIDQLDGPRIVELRIRYSGGVSVAITEEQF